jgi:microsomal dipeptidase-like Zn-dependent dipeptidase
MNDPTMKAIPETGGVVCATGLGLFLNNDGDATPEAYAKHVQYTGELIGRDKTCFATDYLHNAMGMFSSNVANVDA